MQSSSVVHSCHHDSDQRVGLADHQGVQEVLQTAGAQGGVCLWRHWYQWTGKHVPACTWCLLMFRKHLNMSSSLNNFTLSIFSIIDFNSTLFNRIMANRAQWWLRKWKWLNLLEYSLMFRLLSWREELRSSCALQEEWLTCWGPTVVSSNA